MGIVWLIPFSTTFATTFDEMFTIEEWVLKMNDWYCVYDSSNDSYSNCTFDGNLEISPDVKIIDIPSYVTLEINWDLIIPETVEKSNANFDYTRIC